MKTQLIKTQDKFILVSDEEIQIGDWYNSNLGTNKLGSTTRNVEQYRQKLIADNDVSELPSIDFSLLSEEDCKTIGWVDTWEYFKIVDGTCEKGEYEHWLFNEGFKTAQSLNDKMFSLEDMDNAYIQGANDASLEGNKRKMRLDYLQSLQQTSWDVEVEMEDYFHSPSPIGMSVDERPKITNNSIKVLRIL